MTEETTPAPTADRDAVSDLEHELTVFFRRARQASASMAHDIHPDLDQPSYAVMVVINELQQTRSDGVRAVDVVDLLGVHKSTMSRNVAQLESLGLVTRVPDPADARARLLSITEAGRSAVSVTRTARHQRMERRLAEWSDEDLVTLARALRRLNDDLAG